MTPNFQKEKKTNQTKIENKAIDSCILSSPAYTLIERVTFDSFLGLFKFYSPLPLLVIVHWKLRRYGTDLSQLLVGKSVLKI